MSRGGLIVATILLTMAMGVWSWFWTTFPVNDGIGARWNDADWHRAANASVLRGVAYAAITAAALLWMGHRARKLAPAISMSLMIMLAIASATVIVAFTWYGSRTFLAIRPLF
jgi:hypothetical protein